MAGGSRGKAGGGTAADPVASPPVAPPSGDAGGAALLLTPRDDVAAQHLPAAPRQPLPASFLSASRGANCQKGSAGVARDASRAGTS